MSHTLLVARTISCAWNNALIQLLPVFSTLAGGKCCVFKKIKFVHLITKQFRNREEGFRSIYLPYAAVVVRVCKNAERYTGVEKVRHRFGISCSTRF